MRRPRPWSRSGTIIVDRILELRPNRAVRHEHTLLIADTKILTQNTSTSPALTNQLPDLIPILFHSTRGDIHNLVGVSIRVLHRPERRVSPFFLIGIEQTVPRFPLNHRSQFPGEI